ncbi:MAG: aromatic ring-hydroxylating dioxygenase subunit alpha [Gammaproteobacteria bacterium]|nr:MAG: aromatic ring-hydroxylating dioxygenase subunit alpha [Gammaproteobacteria bacterium]
MSLNFGPLGSSANQSSTLPGNLYTDPEVFEHEKEAIFRHQWLAIARSAELTEPGDYLTYELLGDPIVVTRDADARLHAFSRVCLHRGCPIAQGSGNAHNGILTCPYHRWTYALDGRLKGTPLMDQAENFDKSSMRLPQISVAEWLGWIFINAEANAAPLAPQLTNLETLMAPFGVADMVCHDTLEFDSPWNWKIMVENFMESYHHIGGHPETLNPRFPAAGTHAVDLAGAFSLLENPARDEAESAPFWVACVFPSTLISLVRGDSPKVAWYQMDIDAHDRFQLKIHLLASPELAANEEYRQTMHATLMAIHLEDIPLCEGVWKGVNSRFHREGRLSHLEAANWRFYNYLRDRLGADR